MLPQLLVVSIAEWSLNTEKVIRYVNTTSHLGLAKRSRARGACSESWRDGLQSRIQESRPRSDHVTIIDTYSCTLQRRCAFYSLILLSARRAPGRPQGKSLVRRAVHLGLPPLWPGLSRFGTWARQNQMLMYFLPY